MMATRAETMNVSVKEPRACSEQERAEFRELVLKSGEVQKRGLEELIENAQALAFMRIDAKLVGIAALKRPRDSYRNRVFTETRAKYAPEGFRHELGWVFVVPEQQGKGYSRPLVEALVGGSKDLYIYATSKTDNTAMHRTLARYGFEREGQPRQSSKRQEQLLLFVRKPNP